MRRKRIKSLIVGLLAIAALLAVAAWNLWKPSRSFAPQLLGLHCDTPGMCIDEPSRTNEALVLKRDAITFMRRKLGAFAADPRFIFCSTATCDRAFGFHGNRAYSFGTVAVVISSHGWQSHFLRHELVHAVQVERIGGFRMLFHSPNWLIEGMAYSMSEDPRRPLIQPWESYRAQYEAWAANNAEDLWQRAAAQ